MKAFAGWAIAGLLFYLFVYPRLEESGFGFSPAPMVQVASSSCSQDYVSASLRNVGEQPLHEVQVHIGLHNSEHAHRLGSFDLTPKTIAPGKTGQFSRSITLPLEVSLFMAGPVECRFTVASRDHKLIRIDE